MIFVVILKSPCFSYWAAAAGDFPWETCRLTGAADTSQGPKSFPSQDFRPTLVAAAIAEVRNVS
jgi:hypothetical protein